LISNIKFLLSTVFAVCTLATSGQAGAAGCLKGAAVGGAAGHVLGHHTVIGAIGGCVVGRHLADKESKAAQQSKIDSDPTKKSTNSKPLQD
jgi:outer membrane lipoprotein SlyB